MYFSGNLFVILLAAISYLTVQPVFSQETTPRDEALQTSERTAADADFEQNMAKGRKAFANKDYQLSVQAFKAAVVTNGSDFTARYSLGVAYLDENSYELAAESLEQAYKINSTCTRLCEYLGFTYQKLGRPVFAAHFYERSLQLDPNSAFNQNNLAVSYFDLQRYDDAAAAFTEALRLQPHFADAIDGLCLTQTVRDKFDEALDFCLDSVERNANSATLQYVIGYNLLSLHRYGEALARFDRAVQLAPDSAEAFAGRGNANYQQGNFEAALNDFKSALKTKPGLSEALTGLGSSYFRLKRFKDAEESFKHALEIYPDSATAHYNLAIVCLQLNDHDCALQQYNSVKRVEPITANDLFRRIFAGRVVDVRANGTPQ
ncbi:MAG: tetratricopeptide repeat protein [Pyrinomonadaceae bacterium]